MKRDDDNDADFDPTKEHKEIPRTKKQRIGPTQMEADQATRPGPASSGAAEQTEYKEAEEQSKRPEIQRERPATVEDHKKHDRKSSKAESPQPPPVSALASGLVSVSPASIQAEMENIWSLIQQVARSILGGGGGANDKTGIVSNPDPELRPLYVLQFGENWQQNFNAMNAEQTWTRVDALEACLVAALHMLVFRKEAPWPGPKDTVSSLQDDIAAADDILTQAGAGIDLETTLWKAAATKLETRVFQQGVINPAAANVAGQIMTILGPQFQKLGVAGVGKRQNVFQQERTAEVAQIVARSLLLKGRLRAAPSYYSCMWPNFSANFSSAFLEDVSGGRGKREVTWAVTPLVRYKITKSDSLHVASPSKCFTRRQESEGV
ncbi:hypothetical protein LTR86_001103 [Recurvomyces mirabilis]|nr:hypothetical protein LTR86_001103 [Recurvomyces mirabilis]